MTFTYNRVEKRKWDMDQLIQVRVSEELKKEATDLFEELGIDLSTAIRMFLRTCIREGGIPFTMKTKTLKIDEVAERALDELNAEAERNGTNKMSLDEINEIIRLAREERKKK